MYRVIVEDDSDAEMKKKLPQIRLRIEEFQMALISFVMIKFPQIDVFYSKLLRVYAHKSVWDVFVVKD